MMGQVSQMDVLFRDEDEDLFGDGQGSDDETSKSANAPDWMDDDDSDGWFE
jgi:hypothetical protein